MDDFQPLDEGRDKDRTGTWKMFDQVHPGYTKNSKLVGLSRQESKTKTE
jgi:hypothetical protein